MHGLPVDGLFFATGGQPKRILVITEKQQLVQFVVESLCRASVAIEVVLAADSYEAQCQATASRPDLIVLGDTFHAADGLRMCRWLRDRALFEPTKVLAVVDDNGDDRHRRRICFVADEVVRQPLDGRAFRPQVYALLMDSDVLHPVSAGVPERACCSSGVSLQSPGRSHVVGDWVERGALLEAGACAAFCGNVVLGTSPAHS